MSGNTTWRKVTCHEREAIIDGLGRSYNGPAAPVGPVMGRSDLGGEYGLPRIETIWGDTDDGDRELLYDVRHPGEHPRTGDDGWRTPDRLPCEHYVAVGTRAEEFVTPAPHPTTTKGQA